MSMHSLKLPREMRREHFGEQGWEYTEYENGIRVLTRTEETSWWDKMRRRLSGESPETIRSEFTIIYDTVVGSAEPPDGSFKDTFTLYRSGTRVGMVDNTMLPPVILGKFREQAIPYSEIPSRADA